MIEIVNATQIILSESVSPKTPTELTVVRKILLRHKCCATEPPQWREMPKSGLTVIGLLRRKGVDGTEKKEKEGKKKQKTNV